MTVTTSLDQNWKNYFYSELGVPSSYSWNEEEPAMVRPSGNLAQAQAAHASEAGGLMVYSAGEEEPIASNENDMLWSVNARLAMENAMLRRNMQMAYSTDATQASSTAAAAHHNPYSAWPGMSGGYPVEAMAAMPAYLPNPWYPPHHMAAGGGDALNYLQSRANYRGARSRAKTEGDILDAGGSGETVSRRSRAWSTNDVGLGDHEGESGGATDAEKTTAMLRNLPNNYSRAMLLELIDSQGFVGRYDFVYLPMDFKSHASLGYAFVNLLTPELAQQFWAKLDGFDHWAVPSQKVCSMSWSHPHQGLQAHTDRYRNSPVMHEDVPDEYKPVVFKDGIRLLFPPSTVKLRAPAMGRARAGRQRLGDGEERTD